MEVSNTSQQHPNKITSNADGQSSSSLQGQAQLHYGQAQTPQNQLDSQMLYDQSNPQSASGTEFTTQNSNLLAGGIVSEGFGTAAVTDSGTEFVGKLKKHHHHNKRGGGSPSDNTNGINSTSIKENDRQSSAGSNISDDDAPNIPGVRRKASQSFVVPSTSGGPQLLGFGAPGLSQIAEDNIGDPRSFAMIDHSNSLQNNQLREEIEKMQINSKYFIPPPENLMPKSLCNSEPIRSGAPFSFIKTDSLRGDERKEELMNAPKDKAGINHKDDSYGLTKPNSQFIVDDLVRAFHENRLVYCRFGKQFIINLERQMQSLLTNGQVAISAKTATYLINIKKLMKDHNIESDNVVQMRTNSNIKNTHDAPPPPLPYYYPDGEQDKTLVFESRFESGNLLASIKMSDNEYEMFLQNDINTNGHTQWYFFRVSNTRSHNKVKFNINNLSKSDSLYNDGMRILAFSVRAKKEKNLGWHRIGSDISYYQNNYKKENVRFTRYYYTFTFTHTFEYDEDQVYFAHCFPYTYSDLQDDLTKIEKDPYTQNFFYRNTLCRSLAGNKVEFLTVTSKDKDPTSEKALSKKGIFISSRVHPGESNASWMMKGLIDFLVSSAPEAKALREKFVFKIVPMINVDGVINGNYRCSLCGSDLNRRYKAPSKVLHPSIHSIKRFVRAFQKERELALYIDLHGHSRKKNVFMYGNSSNNPFEATVNRLYPYILSKLCDFFSFESSRFSMHKSKESTARIAMYRELKIPSIYTLEASFSGADMGNLKDHHFTTDHLMLMGRKVLEALLVFQKVNVPQVLADINKPSKKDKKELPTPADVPHEEEKELEVPPMDQTYLELNYDNIHKELSDNKQLIKMTEGREDGEGGSSGSESDPSEDNMEEEEIAQYVPQSAKKKIPEKPKKPAPEVKPPPKKEEKPAPPKKEVKPQPKAPIKSPVKKVINYANPLYDRLKLRQLKKIEMVDAWTQTSDRSGSNRKKNTADKNADPNAAALTDPNGTSPDQKVYKSSQQVNISQSEVQDPNRSVQMQDSGSSPQPQIRIRKDPLKGGNNQQYASSLAKFEEKLLVNQIPTQHINQIQINVQEHPSPRSLSNINKSLSNQKPSLNLPGTQHNYPANFMYNSNVNHNRQPSNIETASKGGSQRYPQNEFNPYSQSAALNNVMQSPKGQNQLIKPQPVPVSSTTGRASDNFSQSRTKFELPGSNAVIISPEGGYPATMVGEFSSPLKIGNRPSLYSASQLEKQSMQSGPQSHKVPQQQYQQLARDGDNNGNRLMSGGLKRGSELQSNLINTSSNNPQNQQMITPHGMMRQPPAQGMQQIQMLMPGNGQANNRGKSLNGMNQQTTEQLMKNVINAGGNVFKGIINSQNEPSKMMKAGTERNQYQNIIVAGNPSQGGAIFSANQRSGTFQSQNLRQNNPQTQQQQPQQIQLSNIKAAKIAVSGNNNPNAGLIDKTPDRRQK